MRVAWITRSVADYRVPVFKYLCELLDGDFRLIYSKDRTPQRVCCKLTSSLGGAATGLSGEWRLRGGDVTNQFSNKWVLLTYQPGVMQEIKKAGADVLIGDGFFQWSAPSLLRRVFHKTPLVICYERTAFTERRAQWYRRLYRKLALRYIDAMCCNGKLSLEYTQSLGMPAERITTGHMVADTEGMAQRAQQVTEHRKQELRTSWNAQGTVLLYAGQLIPRKGLNELLDAWALLEKNSPGGATLVLVGQGTEEEALRYQAGQLGLTGVRFVGAVDYDSLADYYASADAFIIPTLEDNWSLVVPEAMACGLPILCSRYNGCWPELVKPENGWVFDPLDPQDTLQNLQACLAAGESLQEMGQASRQIAATHTPKAAAQSLYNACQIALNRMKAI